MSDPLGVLGKLWQQAQSGMESEASARGTKDTAHDSMQGQIDQEKLDRASAISTEAGNRSSQDAILAALIAQVQSNLNTEASARGTKDTQLEAAIALETANRTSALASLSTNVNLALADMLALSLSYTDFQAAALSKYVEIPNTSDAMVITGFAQKLTAGWTRSSGTHVALNLGTVTGGVFTTKLSLTAALVLGTSSAVPENFVKPAGTTLAVQYVGLLTNTSNLTAGGLAVVVRKANL